MALWGALTNSSLAMMAHSQGLGTISQNVANVNTNGYKRLDTQFKTVLSETHPNLDIFSVRADHRTEVDRQGGIVSSGRWSDLAIGGDGFFIVNSAFDGSGETLFTRDGAFDSRSYDGDGDGSAESYLVDSNGYFLQGWEAGSGGTVTASSSLSSLSPVYTRPGQTIDGTVTSEASLIANVEAGATAAQSLSMAVHDSQYQSRALTTTWTPNGANAWTVTAAVDGGTITAPASLPVTFTGDGQMTSPSAASTLTVAWDDGSSSSISLDLTGVTQYASDTTIDHVTQNGVGSGVLRSTEFNSQGELVGHFTNGRTSTLFKLPMARFVAPNGLEARTGNLFAATAKAGDMTIAEVTSLNGPGAFVPGSVESANVDMADEFTRMLATQKAYSSAATVFRAADEMVQGAGDLKR